MRVDIYQYSVRSLGRLVELGKPMETPSGVRSDSDHPTTPRPATPPVRPRQ